MQTVMESHPPRGWHLERRVLPPKLRLRMARDTAAGSRVAEADGRGFGPCPSRGLVDSDTHRLDSPAPSVAGV